MVVCIPTLAVTLSQDQQCHSVLHSLLHTSFHSSSCLSGFERKRTCKRILSVLLIIIVSLSDIKHEYNDIKRLAKVVSIRTCIPDPEAPTQSKYLLCEFACTVLCII